MAWSEQWCEAGLFLSPTSFLICARLVWRKHYIMEGMGVRYMVGEGENLKKGWVEGLLYFDDVWILANRG